MTKLGIGFICFIVFLGWAAARINATIQFNMHIGNYISQASTSPNPTIATQKLEAAIAEAKRTNLTAGNTGIFFQFPGNDVGFWYQRLVDSQKILQTLPANDSQLETSNTMMRVHESITAPDGHVRTPQGIEIFPNNVTFFWWGLLSFLGAGLFIILGLVELD